MKVLIADDSNIIRERMVSMLANVNDVEVVGEARNADEAIDYVEKLNPDVVILDIQMPGNGIIALQKIKKKKQAPQIIMFTNYPHEQYQVKCKEFGAEFFFSKAEGFKVVINVLKKLIIN